MTTDGRPSANDAADDGVVKYTAEWRQESLPGAQGVNAKRLAQLLRDRDRLHAADLVHVYPSGVGFGNVSTRWRPQGFLITGTQTSHHKHLSPRHCCVVEDYSITRNWIECRGQTAASSEALTHAAIYELAPNIGAIVHVHNRRMWEHYLGQLPTTNPNIPYGTPEMAAEMKRLWQTSDLESQRALVMAGHVDGMVTLGLDLQEATERMLQLHAELTHP